MLNKKFLGGWSGGALDQGYEFWGEHTDYEII